MTKKRLRAYRVIKAEIEQVQHMLEYGGTHELKQHYTFCLKALADEQLAIEQAIQSLSNRERMVIRYYYIDGLTWEKVCVKMHYSWTQIHKIHSAALEKLKGI